MKRVLILIIALMFYAFPCWGANTVTETVTKGGFTIVISVIDSDWVWTTTLTADKYKNGVPVHAIIFQPGAASDKLSIKDGSDSGPRIFPNILAADTTDGKVIYYGGVNLKPVLDYSDSTLSAGSTVIIILDKGLSR